MSPHDILLPGPADFPAWRSAARTLLAADIPPEGVVWRVPGDAPDLLAVPLADPPEPPPPAAATARIPRGFIALAECAIQHRDPARFALLYRLLWRLTHGEAGLLTHATDPDIIRVEAMAKAVRRDAHKMHAFVRFRRVDTADGPHFIAWFEPDHHILVAEADFFVRRFAGQRWSILTPAGSAHWDGSALLFGPGGHRRDAPEEDAQEALWRTYFAAIFNPARLKPAAMRAEMPMKYWKNLPEAQDIPGLIAAAPARAAAMVDRGATPPAPRRQRAAAAEAPPPPPVGSLEALAAALIADPTLPEWTRQTTGPVFGEGPVGAALCLIGEQPGDAEDLAARPFVGPAGKLLDAMLAEAGIAREALYLTNAVKHFKFVPTGRRRLHQGPDAGDIAHYRPFLRQELGLVAPRLVVTLGATALRAMLGRAQALGPVRAAIQQGMDGWSVFPTIHPAALLRMPDPAARAAGERALVADLCAAAAIVASAGAGGPIDPA